MWELLSLCFLFASVSGHGNKLQNDADLQSSLMPQELNPEVITSKDEPWRAIMPMPRLRREVEKAPALVVNFTSQLQRYSRVTACVVLVAAALVEIILYVLDYLN